MIKGILTRVDFTDKSTIGHLDIYSPSYADDPIFDCYTLEDTVRGDGSVEAVKEQKVQHETAIPYGIYKVRYTLSKRFKKYTWELQKVPCFEGIRIHAGNSDKDTSGCILLGLKRDPSDKDRIIQSALAVSKFETVLWNYPEWELEIRRGE
jgi:hypothetical protein